MVKAKDPLAIESFIYLNRRNDKFIGLDQRYEMGGGFIFAFWSKKLSNSISVEKKELESAFEHFKINEDKFLLCIDRCVPLLSNSVKNNDLALLHDSKDLLINSLIKQNSPFRGGVLLGMLFEIENTSFSDSLTTDSGRLYFKNSFKPTVRLRWQLRPTLDFKLFDNSVIFKFRPYLKLPMPWDWNQTVEGQEKFDFRFDFPMSMTIKIKDNFSIGLKHIIYYDNTPSSYLTSYLNQQNLPLYATLNRLHQISTFHVNFDIN